MQICKQCEDGIISEIRPTGLARMPLASVGALCLNRKCQCDPVISNMNRSTVVSRDCKLLSIKMKTNKISIRSYGSLPDWGCIMRAAYQRLAVLNHSYVQSLR